MRRSDFFVSWYLSECLRARTQSSTLFANANINQQADNHQTGGYQTGRNIKQAKRARVRSTSLVHLAGQLGWSARLVAWLVHLASQLGWSTYRVHCQHQICAGVWEPVSVCAASAGWRAVVEVAGELAYSVPSESRMSTMLSTVACIDCSGTTAGGAR